MPILNRNETPLHLSSVGKHILALIIAFWKINHNFLIVCAVVQALIQFAISEGYSNERYELVTTFPRRKLSYLDFDDTLSAIGLHSQETIFVQERWPSVHRNEIFTEPCGNS